MVLNNFLFKYYQLYGKIVTDKNHLFSSHRTLKNFSEFFINFLVIHFLIFTNMRKYDIKKLWKNFEKILRTLWEENSFYLLLFFCKVDSIWVKNYWKPIFSVLLVINILLTIAKIAKWYRTFQLRLVHSIYRKVLGKNLRNILYMYILWAKFASGQCRYCQTWLN